MTDQQYNVAKLVRENRRLRNTVENLIEAIETANNVNVDTTQARDELPPKARAEDGPKPPWEKEGVSKSEWLGNGSPGQGE